MKKKANDGVRRAGKRKRRVTARKTATLHTQTEALRQQLEATQADFVMTEVSTATTFARVALDASNAEKRQRNTRNAQLGYETALRYSVTRALDKSRDGHFQQELGVLRGLLRRLSEET